MKHLRIDSRLNTGIRLAAVTALMFGTWTCQTRETATTRPAPESTSLERVIANPARLAGQRVVLTGEVDEVFGERAFKLEDDDDLIFDEEVWVITKSPIRLGGEPIQDDDHVAVSGLVRLPEVAGLERELGYDLTPEFERHLERNPVVIADSIERIARTARWSEQDQEGALIGIYSVYVAPDMTALEGRSIELLSVPVRTTTEKGFWVGQEHTNQLFVNAPDQAQNLTMGDRVDVKGKLRKMPPPASAIQQFGIDPALLQQLAEEPLYVEATKVSSSQQAGAQKSGGNFEKFAASPGEYLGQRVSGEAKVTKAISDRGFYLQGPDGAKDVFAVVREDVPKHEMIDINAGQTIRFQANALASNQLDQLEGKLEPDTVEAVSKQSAFLQMHWRDIEILSEVTRK